MSGLALHARTMIRSGHVSIPGGTGERRRRSVSTRVRRRTRRRGPGFGPARPCPGRPKTSSDLKAAARHPRLAYPAPFGRSRTLHASRPACGAPPGIPRSAAPGLTAVPGGHGLAARTPTRVDDNRVAQYVGPGMPAIAPPSGGALRDAGRMPPNRLARRSAPGRRSSPALRPGDLAALTGEVPGCMHRPRRTCGLPHTGCRASTGRSGRAYRCGRAWSGSSIFGGICLSSCPSAPAGGPTRPWGNGFPRPAFPVC